MLVYGTMDCYNSKSMSGDVPFPLLSAIELDRTRECQIRWPLTHFWSLKVLVWLKLNGYKLACNIGVSQIPNVALIVMPEILYMDTPIL